MLSLKKKTLMWGLTAVLAGTVGFVAVVDGKNSFFVNAADGPYTLTLDGTNGKISTTYANSTSEKVISTAKTTSGNAFSMTYCNATTSNDNTNKYVQLKSGSGYVYSTNGVKGLTSIKVTFSVGSGSNMPSLYLSDTTDFSSSTPATLTSGTAVSASHNYFKIAAGSSVLYIGSIVLTYSCVITGGSSSSSSASTSTSTSSSSSTSSSDAYSLISGTSGLVVGDSYIIGNSKTSGTGKFISTSLSGTTYQAATTNTITDGLLVTPTSATEEFILGGASGAYTFLSTKRTTNGYLSANSDFSYQLDVSNVSTLTNYNKWAITFASGLANIVNNGNSRYVDYYTSDGDFECYSSSNVYLYHKTAAAAGPSLTISPTTLSLTVGSSDGTITANPASGATLSITNTDASIATATLTNETVTVHPLTAGTTTISVIATMDGLSTTKTCVVTVAPAPTPTLTLSASALTIVGSDQTNETITVSVANFSATPTYTVTSTDENVVIGSVSNGKLSILTGTITVQSTQTLTVTATYNTETSSANVVLTIQPVVAVTGVAITGSDSVTVGGTITLTATVTGGTDKTVAWSSASTATATVDSTGVVTGKAVGMVVITATSNQDATKSATKAITVAAATVTDPIIATSTASSLKYSQVEASSDIYTLPSTGTVAKPVKMLVLPISITDFASNATAANLTQIKKTLGDGYDASASGWETLKSFYNTSSYGKLNLDVTVATYTSAKSVNGWYNSGLSTATIISNNDSYESQVSSMMSAALANYKTASGSTCKDFDTDGNGYIDGVIAVYSAPDMEQHSYTDSNDTFWAFTYQAYDSSGNLLTASTTSPVVHKYFWASYDFMTEGSYYPSSGSGNTASSTTAAATIAADAHTFIHESGHIMGLDDYYDYDNTCEPMGEVDMMDYNIIDHNAFSKFALGWENAQVITGTGGSLSLTITPSATNSGQIVLIPTGNDGTGWNKSAFDEYIMMEFYTPTGLNAKDSSYAYATRPQAMTENGVRIYHVDARLCKVTYSGSSQTAGAYVDAITTTSTVSTVVSHSNTVKYGTKDTSYKLLTALDHAGVKHRSTTASVNNASLWQDGDTFNYSTYKSQFDVTTSSNDGNGFHYSVAFSNMSASGITLTITHVA
jgi:M6 family metalloprotease-like protein